MILGMKKVYWSTSKVASHIRSGHCSGASNDEVQQFKVRTKLFHGLKILC